MKMQLEMARITDNVSREFDVATTDIYDADGDENTSSSSDSSSGSESGLSSTAAEGAALVERAKRATGSWPVMTTTEPRTGDRSAGRSSFRLSNALALREVRVMKSYRPRLIREGDITAIIRGEIVRILFPNGCSITVEDIFWDGICEFLRVQNPTTLLLF
jgi:hypothetical protein